MHIANQIGWFLTQLSQYTNPPEKKGVLITLYGIFLLYSLFTGLLLSACC